MNTFYNLILTAIFSCIAVIHIYWAFGGNWGKQQAIPTTTNGKPLFTPGFSACLGVSIAFLSLITFIYIENFNYFPPAIYTSLWVCIALIFLVRSTGDFKYVGFFKKIRETKFAKLDTNYYSPLCLFIALLIILKIFSK